MLLRLDHAGKRYGDRWLFTDASLDVRPGDRIGLVGPNGAGKTSLLRILAREEPVDEGRVLAARGVRVARLQQEVDPHRDHSVRDEVSRGLATLDRLAQEIRALEARMAEHGRSGRELPAALAERYDQLRTRFEREGGFEREARIERVLEGLGFPPDERDRPLRSFSGGWLVRVELARLLLSQPDVLLLDEPTNHLDLASVEWLESYLDEYPGAVVAVSHDRAFLARHVQRIAALEGGHLQVYPGGYEEFCRQRDASRLEAEARRRQQERRTREVERFVERFRAKASKARQVQSRLKMLERMAPAPEPESRRRRLRVHVPEPPRAGESVLRLSGVHKRYGDRVVYAGIDLTIRRGERVALVGPNGAGKSTLLRILAGVLPPDAGSRRVGHNVRVAFYAQHQLEALDPANSVLEELARVASLEDQPRLRTHLGAFLFSGDEVDKPVAVLSGGEKARLALAKLLLRPVNCLCLDEPTNHLDLEAAEAVESALLAYRGTLVLISHDRSFLNALATRVVEVRDGRLRDFPGNYDDYRRRAGEPAPGAPDPATAEAPVPAASTAREERIRAREEARRRERSARRVARELAALEAEIAEHEQALEALRWKLGEPEVHRNGARVRALDAERRELEQRIAELYARWEPLAERAEADALEN